MDVVTLKKAVKDAGKYTDQEVSALEALFADSRIVEQGSNENGEYWRWENGLQVCFKGLVSSGTFASELENSYTWEYPASFASQPPYRNVVISRTDVSGEPSAMITSIGPAAVSLRSLRAEFSVKNTSGTQQVIQTSGLAMGRWK